MQLFCLNKNHLTSGHLLHQFLEEMCGGMYYGGLYDDDDDDDDDDDV